MKLMQLILLSFVVKGAELSSEWSPIEFKSNALCMVWVDDRSRYDPAVIDTFFDRVVSITFYNRTAKGRQFSNEGTGVLITKDLVLTSFNAFRNISSKRNTLDKIVLTAILARRLDGTYGKTIFYSVYNNNAIRCGRQVIPPIDYDARPIHMKHGHHSPLHDLMVMRLDRSVTFVTPDPPVLNSFPDYKKWKADRYGNTTLHTKENFSPIRTIVAKPGDTLTPNEMRFASLGHINDLHIIKSRYLELGKFGDIVDCEEWFPRDWGLFICLKNTEDYPGLANGAVLFSGLKLFGIGSFMLRKGGSSILVFTDVRPYWDLLHRTCTNDDQNLRVPPDLQTVN